MDPLTLPHDASSSGNGDAGSARRSLDRPLGGDGLAGPASAPGSQAATPTAREPGWPQLPPVATRPRSPLAAEVAGAHAGSDAPQQCVLLRAGGIMSKLDLQEGSEVLLSDAIECFWLPVAPTAGAGASPGEPAGASTGGSGGISRASSFAGPGGASANGTGAPGASLSTSSSTVGMARQTSEAEFGAAAASRLASELSDGAGGGAAAGRAPPPKVEMPWWTYGARGMQVCERACTGAPLLLVRCSGCALQLAARSSAVPHTAPTPARPATRLPYSTPHPASCGSPPRSLSRSRPACAPWRRRPPPPAWRRRRRRRPPTQQTQSSSSIARCTQLVSRWLRCPSLVRRRAGAYTMGSAGCAVRCWMDGWGLARGAVRTPTGSLTYPAR